MKKIIMLLVTGAIALGFIACNDDEAGKDKVISADELFLPRNNYPVDLAKNPTVQFEWAASKTDAGGYILYEVLFDKETGDFSNPIYIIPSSNNGYKPTVDISTTVLNTIAITAGAAPGETAVVKWTVRSWRKLSSTNYSGDYGVRTLAINRPNKIDPLPEEVHIQGTSTENAEEILLNEALPISTAKGKHIENRESGAFECFTKLTVGEISVVDDMGRNFTLGENGIINRAEGNATNAIVKEGVYWVYFNFNTMTGSIREISKVQLWLLPNTANSTDMAYIGGGTWNIANYDWKINGDSRHYFLVTYADGFKERWAYWDDDCRNADPASNAKYFNIYRFDSNALKDDWAHTWKTKENQQEGFNKLITINIYMNTTHNPKNTNYQYDRVFTDK